MYVAPRRTSSTTSSRRISATAPRKSSSASVRAGRAVGIPEVGEQARARQRHLQDAVGAPVRVRKLVGREEALLPKRSLDGDRRSLDVHLAELVRLPLAPEKGVQVPFAEPVDCLGQLALEREPAHLAVRDDVEPGLLLEAERRVDGCVLHALELGRRQLTGLPLLARFQQLGRPEQAADDVAASREHAATLDQAVSSTERARAA